MMRIGMTDAEREQHTPGRGIRTPGKGRWTNEHMNLERSLADVYDIQLRKNRGGRADKPVFYWVWVPRKSSDART